MLRQRLIYGISLAVVIIGLMVADAYLASLHPPQWHIDGVNVAHWLYNGALTTALILTLTLLAVRELTLWAHSRGHRPLRFVMYFFAAGLAIGPYISFNLKKTAALYDESWGMLWVALALGMSFLLQAVRRGTENALLNISITLFCVLYAGFAGFMTKLRMEAGMQIGSVAGPVLLLFSVFVVKLTDVGAFFTGMLIGRHKFVPWLSPKKTWEGVAGGVAFAILCAIGGGALLHAQGILSPEQGFFVTPAGLAIFGVLMAVFSISGDLAESLLKRDLALKDSGNTFPGLGGVLDVLDSPLMAAPMAWFFWTRMVPLGS